ncbi:hypothetical protein COOONC_02470, partial [Cooperia oncophora]
MYSAPSIILVTYPQAISGMPASGIFAFLLFFMFFLLGISSHFGLTQTFITTLASQFPALQKWKGLVVGGFCLFSLLDELIMCWQFGIYWFHLFFNTIGGTAVLSPCFVEVFFIVFAYGIETLRRDIQENIGIPT